MRSNFEKSCQLSFRDFLIKFNAYFQRLSAEEANLVGANISDMRMAVVQCYPEVHKLMGRLSKTKGLPKIHSLLLQVGVQANHKKSRLSIVLILMQAFNRMSLQLASRSYRAINPVGCRVTRTIRASTPLALFYSEPDYRQFLFFEHCTECIAKL
jgi:hypothetical protein